MLKEYLKVCLFPPGSLKAVPTSGEQSWKQKSWAAQLLFTVSKASPRNLSYARPVTFCHNVCKARALSEPVISNLTREMVSLKREDISEILESFDKKHFKPEIQNSVILAIELLLTIRNSQAQDYFQEQQTQ